MTKATLFLSALLLLLAVILGAFGAHGLKDQITASQLDTFETANRYHMYHALGMFLTGILMLQNTFRGLGYVSTLLIAGIVLFSGSLYLLSTKDLLGIAHWSWLGPVTPAGGLCFILAWGILAWSVLKHKMP